MTKDELRAAAGQRVPLHQRFAPLFGRKEARAQSLVSLNGLLLAQGRKSAEPMALVFGAAGPDADADEPWRVLALQRFLTQSPGQATAVQREIQAAFAERRMPAAADSPIGTGGVLDGSAFVKKGTERGGVARQYCGRRGKLENCQVGAFLTGVPPAGTALLEHHRYLPKKGAQDRPRRQKTQAPPGLKFRTKPQLASAVLERTRQQGLVGFDGVAADEEFGNNGTFLDDLEAVGQRSLVEVPVTPTVWTEDPATCVPPYAGQGRPPSRPEREAVQSVRAMAGRLPAGAWPALQLRDGAAGPLVFEFARVRVWAVRHRRPGPGVWLLIRRSLEVRPAVKYYLSNAGPEAGLAPMALVTGIRGRVEEFVEEAKGYLGMAHYEARAWTSWHHHMSLVALAHLFVPLARERLKKSPGVDVGHDRAALEACLVPA